MANEVPQEIAAIWTARGLSLQEFPIYYSMGPQNFTDGQGNPAGGVGARAVMSKAINNFPHLFLAIRIDNYYDLPTDADADTVARYRAMKDYIDQEQTVSIQLAQQNITADAVMQTQLCGRFGSGDWHPFPVPFPMAGGNSIQLTIQRLTAYPQLVEGEDLTPQCRASLVATMFRGDLQTTAVHRMMPQR